MASLSQFLHSHSARDKPITHTRIPDKDRGIQGGSYHIDDEELGFFFQRYHAHVLGSAPMPEYLTEKQRENGPLALDLDFRYRDTRRIYTEAHIELFINMVMEELQRMFEELPSDIEVYVMEKSAVNAKSADLIKDGIHLLMGINMDKTSKEMLRMRMLLRMDSIWDELKPHLKNEWDSVLDRGVMITTTGWQLYGSRKPAHEPYKLTLFYRASITDGAPLIQKFIAPVVTASLLPKLSVRYQEYPTLDNLREVYQEEYDTLRLGSSKNRNPVRMVDLTMQPVFSELRTPEEVDQALARLFEKLGVQNHKVREAYEFAMVLPEKYYMPYEGWIRVGFALKNTHELLFPVWIKFSMKSPLFDFAKVPEYFQLWTSWVKKDEGITMRSLAFWAKTENPEAYHRVIRGSVDLLVDEICKAPHPTEYDLAVLLHTAYQDRFVCTSIKNNIWYAFENHRWVETDTGSVLRLELSTSIYTLFAKKMHEGIMKDGPDLDKDAQSLAAKRVNKISGIIVDLKNHTKKRNIMKEAADLFFERNFVTKLDSKPFIIGCTNGVIDFECPHLFRAGKVDDYVSKSTRIEYAPLTPEHDAIVDEIEVFFRQLFPVEELRVYMFDFLASLLVGKNHNQTFNILTGVGRNGKSALVELIGHVMGEYKATVPVSLITQKRQGIGASSSEVAQLMGVRFAVMQEPSKGDRINEGILKELTGGDPLQARALFKDSVTFEVLFKLIMCANDLPEIKSNDEGTWRRIRVCPFVSLFCETPVLDDPDKPYQFLVNKNMNEQFIKWSPVLFSMLVERARVTKGIVNDCPLVLSKSNEYRCDQDLFSEFIRTCIKADTGSQIENAVLSEAFVDWWKSNQSAGSRQPSNKELTQYMTRRNIGVRVSPPGRPVAWKNISLVQPEP